MESREDLLSVVKRRSASSGVQTQQQGKRWEPVLELHVISAPLAIRPQWAHKGLVSEGLNERGFM